MLSPEKNVIQYICKIHVCYQENTIQIVERGGGGAMNVFPSGYVLLDCNLTGLVSCSDIHVLGTLVRLRFVRLCVTTLNKSLNVT